MRFRYSSFFRRGICGLVLSALLCGFFFSCLWWHQDERTFRNISRELFYSEMTGNTLNMHYTLAFPESFGIEDYEVTLPCYSPEAEAASRVETENLLNRLCDLNPEKLSDTSALSCSLLIKSLENSLELGAFSLYEEPLSPAGGIQSRLPILLAEYTFRSRRDVEDYLKILDQTDEYFASLLTFERQKVKAGLFMAEVSAKKVILQCDTVLSETALKSKTHFLQTTFRERLDSLVEQDIITAEDAAGYEAENHRLLTTVLRPAYEALGDGLLILADPETPLKGLCCKPMGKEYYEALLYAQTGSGRSVEEIKSLISEQFSKEYASYDKLLSSLPDKELSAYNTLVQNNFPLKNIPQMLEDLQTRMEGSFPSFSGNEAIPRVTVKPVSEYLADFCAPAFYLTPPLDDTDTNAIYINQKSTPDGLELYTTLAHEGYPGHLYQTVWHQQNIMSAGIDAVSCIRELLWYGGYLEGWALYVEFLSYGYASSLSLENAQPELSDAIRLAGMQRSLLLALYSLLDIMIHYEGADRARTAALLSGFGITDEDSVSAIYEYIAEEPVNYLKYYLGYLEILSLKEKARQLWSEQYSDLAFHTFLLNSGPADFETLQTLLIQDHSSSMASR